MPDVLANCKKCFLVRWDALLKDRHSKSDLAACTHYCQWDLNSKSSLAKKVLVPLKYPTTCDTDSPDVPGGREMGALFILPIKKKSPGLPLQFCLLHITPLLVHGIKE